MRNKWIGLVFICIASIGISPTAYASISRDSTAGNVGWSDCSTSPFTRSFTTNTGDTTLIVYISSGSVHDPITGVTFNGDSFTLGKKQDRGDGALTNYVYYLNNPSIGTFDITVSLNASEPYCVVSVASYQGTDGNAPEATSGTNSSPLTLTTTTNNDWVVGGAYNGGTTFSSGSLTFLDGDTGTAIMFDTNTALNTGAQSFSFTGAGGSFMTVGMTLQPLGASSTSSSTIPIAYSNATTTDELIGSINYGLAIIIVILSIAVSGYIFNSFQTNKKKPWQK